MVLSLIWLHSLVCISISPCLPMCALLTRELQFCKATFCGCLWWSEHSSERPQALDSGHSCPVHLFIKCHALEVPFDVLFTGFQTDEPLVVSWTAPWGMIIVILLDFYLPDLESQAGVKVWSAARGSLSDFECVYGSLRPLPPSPLPFFTQAHLPSSPCYGVQLSVVLLLRM